MTIQEEAFARYLTARIHNTCPHCEPLDSAHTTTQKRIAKLIKVAAPIEVLQREQAILEYIGEHYDSF